MTKAAQEALERFKDEGFATFRDVVPTPLVEQLRDLAERLHAASRGDDVEGDTPFLAIDNLLECFELPEALWNDSVSEMLILLFREAGISMNSVRSRIIPFKFAFAALRIARTGSTPMALHNDTPHLFGGRFGVLPTTSVQMMIPVTPFTFETGATRMIAGSHKRLQDPPGLSDEPAQWIRDHCVEAEPGDLVVMDMRTWHGAGANRTANPRYMFSIGYQAEWFSLSYPRLSPVTYSGLPALARFAAQPRQDAQAVTSRPAGPGHTRLIDGAGQKSVR